MPWGKPDAGDVAKPDGVVSGRMKPPQPLFVRLSLVLDPHAWCARLAGKAEHTARRSGGVFVKPFCSAPVSAPDARKRGCSAAAAAGLRCGGQHHAAEKEVLALQPLRAHEPRAVCGGRTSRTTRASLACSVSGVQLTWSRRGESNSLQRGRVGAAWAAQQTGPTSTSVAAHTGRASLACSVSGVHLTYNRPGESSSSQQCRVGAAWGATQTCRA